jgi:hypothetical protein
MIECNPTTERLRISVNTFTVTRSWYQITAGRNIITATNLETNEETTITIAVGTYSYADLCKLISLAYPPVKATYSYTYNQITLKTTVPHRWTFVPGIAEIMGFLFDIPMEGVIVQSLIACKPVATEAIHIEVVNLPPMDDSVNLTNVNGTVEPDSKLAIIPITNTKPFHICNWLNETDVGLFTSEYKLNLLELRFADEQGRRLAFLPEHTMTLKIDTYELNENQDMLQLLREIREDLRDIALQQALGNEGTFVTGNNQGSGGGEQGMMMPPQQGMEPIPQGRLRPPLWSMPMIAGGGLGRIVGGGSGMNYASATEMQQT